MTDTSCLLHPAGTPGWPATCSECQKHDAEHLAKFRPDLDERAVCRSCPRRLGKSESVTGQCMFCQRIAAAQERAGVTS